MPKSVTKYSKKNGLTFVDNVDRVNYTIRELIQRANVDVGIFLRKKIIEKAKKSRFMFKNVWVTGIIKKGMKSPAFLYWARKKEGDLLIGTKTDTWYGVEQELGSTRMPKKGLIYETVKENIDNIRLIQGKYLSAIEDENKALGLIKDEEDDANG